MIPDESVTEFKRLYEREFNEEVSFDDAREMARNLVDLYDLLSRPYPGEAPSEPPAEAS